MSASGGEQPMNQTARQPSWWRAPFIVAALAVALAGAAQGLTVRYNYAGNWTGLFCHGALLPFRASLPGETLFLHADTAGYDGQLYHVIAHDPFLRHDSARYLDSPSLRYRRILVPALAYLLGFGIPHLVDAAYLGLILACVGLGAGMLAAWAQDHAWAPAWGLLFLLIPATLVSLDRLTIDVSLAALTVSAVVLANRRRYAWLFVVVALALLCRETGLLLWAALIAAFALARDWRRAAWFALAVLPTLAWYAYVAALTRPDGYANNLVPLSGIWRAWLDPLVHRARVVQADTGLHPLHAAWRMVAPVVTASLARLALAGYVAAVVIAFAGLRRARTFPTIAAALFACLAVFLQRPDIWTDPYSCGRVFSPLVVLILMEAIGQRRLRGLVILAMVALTVLQEMAGQLKGIARGVLGL